MNNRAVFLLGFFFLALFSCNSGVDFKLQPLDLAQYGIPLSIMAPDSAKVKKSKIGDWDDVTVKKGTYSLQVLAKKAPAQTAEEMKNEELATVKADKFFSKVLVDDDNGFVFETTIDSLNYYDFRYIHMQGDRVFSFQKGFTDNLTMAEAKEMYASVKQ